MNIFEAIQGMYAVKAPVRRKAWASVVYVYPGDKIDAGPWLHYMENGMESFMRFIPSDRDYLTEDWEWYEKVMG